MTKHLVHVVFGFVVIDVIARSEEHTSELQSLRHLVCRLLLEKNRTVDQGTLAPCARRPSHQRRGSAQTNTARYAATAGPRRQGWFFYKGTVPRHASRHSRDRGPPH